MNLMKYTVVYETLICLTSLMLSSWTTVELFYQTQFSSNTILQLQAMHKNVCIVLVPMSNLLFRTINSSVQLFSVCFYMLISSHSTKFLKEHISMKNWRRSDEWKISLFFTSYNQIIVWSSILYSAFGIIVLQAKEKE